MKTFLPIVLSFLWFAACASSPSKPSDTTARTRYISTVNQRLHEFSQAAATKTASDAGKLRQNIARTRTLLGKLKSAPKGQWASYLPEVQDSLDKTHDAYEKAHPAE